MNRAFVPALGVSVAVLGAAIAAPAAATPQASGVQPIRYEPYRMSAAELAIWNEASFQKRFVDSYLSETEIEPRVNANELKQMRKVLDLMSSDQVEKAEAQLRKSIDPASSAVFDFTLANIHFQRDEFDQAAELYQSAIEKHPKFRRAWKNLALIRVRQADYPAALPALSEVVSLGGGDAITYGLLGFSYSNVENELAAESAYRMAILLDPATQDWQMGLAPASFFKQQRFADAAALCGQLIEAEPDRAELWLLQANAFIGLGKPLRAAENYELVDRMGQSSPESLSMLADIYVNEGLFDLAVDTYGRVMELDSGASPERAIRAAKVLAQRGALGETAELVAKIDVVHGSRLAPDDRKELLKLQARIAVARGASDEEARVLEEIVELDPLDGEALILLGQHSARGGDSASAAFYYERAAALEAFEADAKVRHAQLLVSQGKYDEALPMLRRAEQVKPRENIQQYLEQVERVSKSRS